MHMVNRLRVNTSSSFLGLGRRFAQRGPSQAGLHSKALVHDVPGEPLEVLRLQEQEVPDAPAEDGVLVRYLAVSRCDWGRMRESTQLQNARGA